MPTRRSREPKTSKRWNHARLSVEVRGKALELCTSGGVEGQRKIHKDAEDLMCSSRNEFFSRVMGVLAGNECFWTVLEDIKFVRMLPCVCRGVNDVMSVKANALPYWGVWTHCLRDHRWDEINTIMGVRKNYLPLLRDVSQEVPPTPPHRRVMRVYSLRGVMEKMIEMHGGETSEGPASVWVWS